MAYIVTNITKNGSDILISLANQEKPMKVKYDPSNHSFLITSFTGNSIKRFPSLVSAGCPEGFRDGIDRAIFVLRKTIQTSSPYFIKEFEALEKFFTNLDLIDRYGDIASECPKGFVKWLREKHLKATLKNLREFTSLENERLLTKEEKVFYNLLREVSSWEDRYLWYPNGNKELRVKFNRMVRVSAKELCLRLSDEIYNWVSVFIKDKRGEKAFGKKWFNYLDDNRSLAYNIKLANAKLCEERNLHVLKNEAKIKKIETLSNENYVVVVPSTMEEFTKEGEMQNNCVGYYYHDNIAEGKDFVYFIRRASDPTRSYITNRYHVYDHETTESRIVDNKLNEDVEALKLISLIDEMITELLAS